MSWTETDFGLYAQQMTAAHLTQQRLGILIQRKRLARLIDADMPILEQESLLASLATTIIVHSLKTAGQAPCLEKKIQSI